MAKTEDLGKFLFHQGTNYYSYDYLGCNRIFSPEGFIYSFRTWAPGADYVLLVSDFTDWNNGIEMQRLEGGVFEAVVTSGISLEGQKYKFLISRNGKRVYKGDPYARASVGFDDGASVVFCERRYNWTDKSWKKYRRATVKSDKKYISAPINIYEVHLGSFKRSDGGGYLNYREIGQILVRYLKYMGYTHVELLPLYEHPYDGSWGYQVGAFYAPSTRFGTPDDLKYMINLLHAAGIGVIFDWVCAHFPKDEWGLYEYDGAPLYEYQGVDRQESRSWGTRFFDLGRGEVQSFLISNALYFLREFHVDGLRVDAVASMLYLDYDRSPGEWIPNSKGGRANVEAEAFLKKLNSAVFKEFSDVLMIAEESGDRGRLTHPVDEGGIGFNLKWNMGWANDLYEYLAIPAHERKNRHSALSFPLMYAFSENYVLPFSHDEVVHGKHSLIDKMCATYEDKFLLFRLTMLMMISYPGKKLTFMGCEFAQYREWDFDSELEWFMLDFEKHCAAREFVAALNRFYLENRELWYDDFTSDGFLWCSVDESDKSSVAFMRRDAEGELVIALNFSDSEVKLSFSVSSFSRAIRVFETAGDTREELITCDGGIMNISLPRLSGKVFRPIKNKEIIL